MLSANRIRVMCVLVLTVASAGLPGRADAQELRLPKGVDAARPTAMKKPKSIALWRVLVAREGLPVFAGPDGDDARRAAVKLGELLYVAAVHDAVGKPRRMLVGRFKNDGADFVEWVGWADAAYLLDERRPLEVRAARDGLLAVLPSEHPFRRKLMTTLPDASRDAANTVTLKAVTHPERGKACFPRPVPAEEYDEAARGADAVALQPFAFFYVYKIAVEPKAVYCLLGPRSETPVLEERRFGERLREHLVGWVDIESLILWTTREAFEVDLRKPPLDYRRKLSRPLELYARDADLRDYASWELAGRRGDNPATAIFREELDGSKAPVDWQKPWPAHWMRYPILASYPLHAQGAPPPAVSGERWMGYQLAVLGTTARPGGAGGQLSPANVEELKKKLNDAVAQLRVFELVLAIDTTGSMDPVFEPVKLGIKDLVSDLKKRSATVSDELEKIQLRVAVVLYKDHESKRKWFLTRNSEDFFDVMTPAGLEAFETWLSAVEAEGGGGERPEQPFEAITEAVEKFLSPGTASKHSPGAAPVIALFGDVGNHKKGDRGTRLDTTDVLRTLSPVGRDRIQGAVRQLARVQLHAVRTVTPPNREDRLWFDQMPELAKESGGTSHEVNFLDGGRADEQLDGIRRALFAAIDARRELMRKELDKIRTDIIRTAGPGAIRALGGDPTKARSAGGAAVVIAEDRLKEVLGPEELKRIREGLSQAYFSIVHAVEQIPGEPERMARLRLCVLLTEQEFLKVQTASQVLGEALDEEITRGGLAGSGDKIESRIKELLIRVMLTAFGETVTAGRVAELMKKSLPEIQREVNQLPVQFGVLRSLPRDEDGLKQLAVALRAKAGLLLEISGSGRHRFFPAGVATGENHIWVYKEELP